MSLRGGAGVWSARRGSIAYHVLTHAATRQPGSLFECGYRVFAEVIEDSEDGFGLF